MHRDHYYILFTLPSSILLLFSPASLLGLVLPPIPRGLFRFSSNVPFMLPISFN